MTLSAAEMLALLLGVVQSVLCPIEMPSAPPARGVDEVTVSALSAGTLTLVIGPVLGRWTTVDVDPPFAEQPRVTVVTVSSAETDVGCGSWAQEV